DSDAIAPPPVLVSVPAATVTADAKLVEVLVNSIRPALAKPLAKVRAAPAKVSSAWRRSIEPAAGVDAALIWLLPPRATSVPWLVSGTLTVVEISPTVRPASLANPSVPLTAELSRLAPSRGLSVPPPWIRLAKLELPGPIVSVPPVMVKDRALVTVRTAVL